MNNNDINNLLRSQAHSLRGIIATLAMMPRHFDAQPSEKTAAARETMDRKLQELLRIAEGLESAVESTTGSAAS